MVLYLGSQDIYDFIARSEATLSTDAGGENIERIIIAENSENAIAAVKFAMDKNLPLLGILDGYQSVVAAFGGTCLAVDCAEGKQEWAVLDTDAPIFAGLETVEKICRGNPEALDEGEKPAELDCIARAETGEILGVRNVLADGTYGHIYAVNYYIHSSLTTNGFNIIDNFLQINVEGQNEL